MSEKEEGLMKLDEHMGQTLTPQELHHSLTKGKSKNWEEKFKAAIKEDCGGLCVLVCKECNTVMSANDPSKSFTSHKCSGAALAKAEALRKSPPASPTTRGQVSSRRRMKQGPAAWSQLPRRLAPWTASQSSLHRLSRFTACWPFMSQQQLQSEIGQHGGARTQTFATTSLSRQRKSLSTSKLTCHLSG